MEETSELNEVYIFHLEKAYKQFKKYKTQVLKSAGVDITSDQWVLLKSIHESEGSNQRELAQRTFKEPASITRTLDLLEKKGWVKRQNVEGDRRTYELYTTAAGRALIKKILPVAVSIREHGAQGINEKELKQFNRTLIKLFKNFSE